MAINKGKLNYKQQKIRDGFLTPTYAIAPLIPYLPKHITYWEPTHMEGSIMADYVAEQTQSAVIKTGIDYDGFDFLKDTPDFDFDFIITNPPYSLKDEFLEKVYSYGKPFAFLLPLTALEGVRRNRLYRKYGLELMVFNRRVQFEGQNVWFPVGWFCWQVLPEKLMFVDLKRG